MIDLEKYTFVIRRTDEDKEEPFVARVVEFPYLSAYGKTPDEAYEIAVDTIRAFEEEKLSLPNPLPNINEFSGRISLRIPKSLHRKLSTYAEVEGVSINQYLVNLLSWASENYYSSMQNAILSQFLISNIRPTLQVGERVNDTRIGEGKKFFLFYQMDQGARVPNPFAPLLESPNQELEKREIRPMVTGVSA